MDPPEHARYRNLIAKSLTPRMVDFARSSNVIETIERARNEVFAYLKELADVRRAALRKEVE